MYFLLCLLQFSRSFCSLLTVMPLDFMKICQLGGGSNHIPVPGSPETTPRKQHAIQKFILYCCCFVLFWESFLPRLAWNSRFFYVNLLSSEITGVVAMPSSVSKHSVTGFLFIIVKILLFFIIELNRIGVYYLASLYQKDYFSLLFIIKGSGKKKS